MTRLNLPLALERHPLRPRILELVAAAGTASPVELARLTGEPLGTVAYHVRTLADLGALRLAAKRRVRGAIEHRYAVTSDGAEAHAATPLEVAIAALERIHAEASYLEEAGGDGAVIAEWSREALERTGRRPETDRALVDAEALGA